MDKEKLLTELGESKTANHVLEWMSPVFSEIEQRLIDSMKGNFRAGSYTELLLACHVAQLCALEDLKVKIKSVALRGETAKEALERVGDFEDGYE